MEENNVGKAKTVPFRKLFSFADKADVALMVIGSIGSIGNGLAMPLMTVIMGQTINSFGMNQRDVAHAISMVAVKYLYLAMGAGVASFLEVTCWMVTGERQAARIRSLYLQTILRQDVAFFDGGMSTGEVIGRMSGDAFLIQDAMGEKVGKFLQLLATFFGGFAVAFIKGWRLSLVMLPAIPLLVIAGATMATIMYKITVKGQQAYADAGNLVEQTIGSIRTVASFCAEDKVTELYRKKCEGPMRSGVRKGLISGLGLGLSAIFLYSFLAISFYLGAILVDHGDATFTDVFQVSIKISKTGFANAIAHNTGADTANAKAAAASVFSIIDMKSQIDSSDESGSVLENVKGEIKLVHVSFSYPSRPDVQIFRDINLAIRSGQTVALVGESGSGKSTVIALLQRFYDPDSGHITLDGVQFKSLQLKWLRKQMGLVGQEPSLFNDTIRANIAYGKEGDATEAEIVSASELANAHVFISGLAQGYDTMVGERGIQLSGGQKQRVAIARAVVKGPKILLLDEATSALDAESERVVQEALDRVMVSRTTVVVAHRLSTVKNADLIAVVKNGVIVEKGSHEGLMSVKGGNYASLVALHSS
ncbi:ABC transporter B family member 21 [Linum perenne]